MLRFTLRSIEQLPFRRKNLIDSYTRAFSSQSFNGRDSDNKFVSRTDKGSNSLTQRFKDSFIRWKDSRGEDTDPAAFRDPVEDIPTQCDVIIIGGGAMGSSTAYWLKHKVFESMKVVVIEKDPTYAKASTTLSVGGLRQQFSLEENIEMSLFGAEFIRNINHHLRLVEEDHIDPCFHPYGYLLLASEVGAETLTKNSKLQNSMGAKNILLSASKLKGMFPWLNTEGIEVGCLGLEKEGWFDPWSLLCALRNKAMCLGAQYITAKAVGFGYKNLENSDVDSEVMEVSKQMNHLIIELPDGERKAIQFGQAVVAAGAFSGEIAQMAKVGTGAGVLGVPLPVEPRKRYVYCFHCPDGPGINTPLTIDPSGTYFRRDGLAGNFICGKSPLPQEEPPIDDLSVDHEYFNEKVWPMLAHRVQAFENLKVKSAWAGYYEYNVFDKNGIIGRHPYYYNLLLATGFSGHGIQQAPAVGRAISELIIDWKYTTIDLTRLGFERFLNDEPMKEANIV